MTAKTEPVHLVDEEESYYVSMTDLMVGVIFIFVIILMYFALQLQQAESRRLTRIDELERAQQARTEMLVDVKESLLKEGIKVEIDEENGILHLPEQVLFESGQASLNSDGQKAIGVLSRSLAEILPCYTPQRVNLGRCKGRIDAQVESLFIEGHTDDKPVSIANPIGDNWRLSAERAIATFKEVQRATPTLDELVNYRRQKLFSVSGYSEYRPRQSNETESGRSANRRIDLRVLMQTPTSEGLKAIDSHLNEMSTNGSPPGSP